MENEGPTVEGKISSVVDHGTIVQLMVEKKEGGIYPVNFDQRMFWSMWDDLGRIPLKNRRVVVHGDPYNQYVEFLDLEDE